MQLENSARPASKDWGLKTTYSRSKRQKNMLQHGEENRPDNSTFSSTTNAILLKLSKHLLFLRTFRSFLLLRAGVFLWRSPRIYKRMICAERFLQSLSPESRSVYSTTSETSDVHLGQERRNSHSLVPFKQ